MAVASSARVREELTRVYDLCHGCRLCFKFCTAFPTLFDYIDRHDDQDAGRMSPAEQDQVVDECFNCKLCYVNCPYIPGQSEWNLTGLFTGWVDVDLTEQGVSEAREAGRKLKAQGLTFDVAYTSALKRAQRTLDLMLEEMGQTGLPVVKDLALNERDYGDLSGLNKDDARKKWGEEQVHIWRRSYDIAPPGGESLRDTAARVLPLSLVNLSRFVTIRFRTLTVVSLMSSTRCCDFACRNA